MSFNRTKSSNFFKSAERFYSNHKNDSRNDLNIQSSDYDNKKPFNNLNLFNNQNSNHTLNPSFCIKSTELLSNRESINQDERNQLIKEFAQSKNIN